MVRATDDVAKGKVALFGRTTVRFMETHMSDRTLCHKEVYQETECFKGDGCNLCQTCLGPSSHATK